MSMLTPDRAALARAHRAAQLRGTLDEALTDPLLALCLANTVDALERPRRPISHNSQPQPARDYKRASAGDID
jgi:hypothetical protein